MNTVKTKFGPLQIAIIFLTVATALIHIWLAISSNLIMFYLNGLGYIVLVVALYLPRFAQRRNTIRWILMGYTAVTILGWVVIGERTTIAYIDKLIELALIGLLWVESRQTA